MKKRDERERVNTHERRESDIDDEGERVRKERESQTGESQTQNGERVRHRR